MTTTITIETHSWPVSVSTSEEHSHNDNLVQSHGYRSTTTFVPKNSKQVFHVSSTSSLSIRELPEDATGLTEYGLLGAGNAVGSQAA